ncbi:hypothetical protein [Haloarcula sp. JP-L23]|uniref:hypothetical protein n=1 Tax=Haloarcula sp. JP-L23 TaxID=2716717 RepID=UPI00140F2651|nr:hypothetical protein G9465_12210 [Haloarcula sp. JP-L23]
MRSAHDRAERKLDRLVDRYAEDVGLVEFELLLQQHAQDLHERAADEGELRTVDVDDIEGWSA